MTDIASNIIGLKNDIPKNVKLVAVSKTKSIDEILRAYETGQRIFGENRVRELIDKKNFLPDDIEWHFVGHLQTNKVKLVLPFSWSFSGMVLRASNLSSLYKPTETSSFKAPEAEIATSSTVSSKLLEEMETESTEMFRVFSGSN